MTEDERNLNLLSIFHYVVGGITAFFACFPLIHVAVGLAMLCGAMDGRHGPPPAFGLVFIFVGGVLVLLGWTLAVAILVAGNKLGNRKAYTFCLVVAALECLMMPFGTILGVFTIVMLMKDSVKNLFASNSAPTTAP